MLEKLLLLVSVIDQVRAYNCFSKVHVSYYGNDCEATIKYSVSNNNGTVENKLKVSHSLFNELISKDIEDIKTKFLSK